MREGYPLNDETVLRDHLQDLPPSEADSAVEVDKEEITRVKHKLTSLKFPAADVEQAIKDVCTLRSTSNWSSPLVNLSPSQSLDEAVMEYLLMMLPEKALPLVFRSRQSNMNVQISTSRNAEELSQSWLADRIHQETGFPLILVRRCLHIAQGDEPTCIDLLVHKSIDPNIDLDELLFSIRGPLAKVDGALRKALHADELLTLRSIYPDNLKQDGHRISLSIPSTNAKLHVLLHDNSAYPLLSSIPTFYCNTLDAPSHLNVWITLEAYEHARTLEDSLENGQGILLELLDHLTTIIPETLARPPKLIDSLLLTGRSSKAKREKMSNGEDKRPQQTYADPLSKRPRSNEEMQDDYEKLQKNQLYQNMLKSRLSLPAWDARNKMVDLVASNRVVLLAGATGSGKTTQIPFFILENEIKRGKGSECSIIVTQPRRLAAIGVATRVAEEWASEVGKGDSIIGYQIRGEKQIGQNCRLLFMTTGVLLRILSTGQSNLARISHIVSLTDLKRQAK